MMIIRTKEYGSYRYEVINGIVWVYGSDIKNKMHIKDYFKSIKKINPDNIRKEVIKTKFGKLNVYLLNIGGVLELMNFSMENQVVIDNFKHCISNKIKNIQEEMIWNYQQ